MITVYCEVGVAVIKYQFHLTVCHWTMSHVIKKVILKTNVIIDKSKLHVLILEYFLIHSSDCSVTKKYENIDS